MKWFALLWGMSIPVMGQSPIIVPIVDSIGRDVATLPTEPMRFLNLYGLETDLYDCQCSFKYGCEYYIDLGGIYGFNGLRLPLSATYVRRGNFDVLDRIIGKAEQLNMTIMLDYHRTDPSHQGDWYETNLMDFLTTWNILLSRYYNRPVVKYVDLFNEFQQGNDKADFWSDIMSQSVHALEKAFPQRYVWVVSGTNWCGTQHGIHIDLPLDNIMYSVHKYSFSGNGGDYVKDWDESFGFIPPEKLIVGEFGWISSVPQQVEWAKLFLAYLKEKGYKNTCFWTIALSGDTGGILKDDCLTLETEKINMLQDFWGFPPSRNLRNSSTTLQIILGNNLRKRYDGIV